MGSETLLEQFDEAMLEIYRRALSEAHYNATRFLQMLHEHRGLETARILMHSAQVSEGYTALWERGRLDLTVEALIHERREFQSLFTPEERETAPRRLEQYNYAPALDPVERVIGAFASDIPHWTARHNEYLGKAWL